MVATAEPRLWDPRRLLALALLETQVALCDPDPDLAQTGDRSNFTAPHRVPRLLRDLASLTAARFVTAARY